MVRTRPAQSARCRHARISKEGGEGFVSRGQATYWYFVGLQFSLDNSSNIDEHRIRMDGVGDEGMCAFV